MHQHDEHCGCGGQHHDSDHVHGERCGCDCGHVHAPVTVPEGLSPIQVDILLALRQRQCLPVACFAYAKTDDAERYAVALEPVYLSTPEDSMEQVKRLGEELAALEDIGLITLDYDIPLRGYPYEEYKTSALYAYFAQVVAEGARRASAAFDTPKLELGSMALTDAGEERVDELVRYR